ncbi:MAG: right-handed parallel beta-helix repeat-containing protein [Planctomycetota bacterium]|jgi:hypothetical protein
MNPLVTAVALVLIAQTTTQSLTAQAILRVPSQHKTIAAALAAAKSGDTILVAPGTYKERLTWPSVDRIRLVAEEGPLKTTIDGEKKGTVIRFVGPSITRKTVVEGFSIINGDQAVPSYRLEGGGVHIKGGSPTIRNNTIRDNLLKANGWALGAGIFVDGSGADPLIAGNLIILNLVTGGIWNYGGGIYIGMSSKADIVANTITRNYCQSPSTGFNFGGGIYAAGAARIVSNIIVDNHCRNASDWGGGVHVAAGLGTVLVLNNTIASNRCWFQGSQSKGVALGGGLYADFNSNITVVGNIVVKNRCTSGGGGLHRNWPSPAGKQLLDYNNVWGNTSGFPWAGDYVGFTKGTNSISKDPKFVSATDYHLTKASPCVDAIPAGHLPTTLAAMDVDGGPRRIDGNLDGLKGNGARLDIGADEFTEVGLTLTGVPQIGKSVKLSISSQNRGLFTFGVDLQTGNLLLEPAGNFLLSARFFPVSNGTTPAGLSFVVPKDNRLAGLTCYHQALVWPSAPAGTGQFTNLLVLTIY